MHQDELNAIVKQYADPYEREGITPEAMETLRRMTHGVGLAPSQDGEAAMVEPQATPASNGIDLSQFSVKEPVPSVGQTDEAVAAKWKYTTHNGGMALIVRKKMKMPRDKDTPEGQEPDEVWVNEHHRMCDFVATITREDTFHQGEETKVIYHIAGATANGFNLPTLKVEAESYSEMKWLSQWGANISIVAAWPRSMGSVTANIREAIIERKKLIEPQREEVFDHLGWRKINSKWVYLHAEGGISEAGLEPGLVVDTGQAGLKTFRFTNIPEGDDLKEAIKASLDILKVTSYTATVPQLLATYRATLPMVPTFALHTFATSGTGKSTLAALYQAHFDDTSHCYKLPGTWMSTAASLEVLCNAAKNSLITIDDANMSQPDIMKKMEKIIRSSGNGTSRGRMTSAMKTQRAFPPRCMVLSTGEDLPEGHSCRARTLLVDVPEVVHPSADNSLLDDLQAKARAGYMNRGMAAWLQWLAPKIDRIESGWGESMIETRKSMDMAIMGAHGRSVDAIAELLITGQLLLTWAQEEGAITADEANRLTLDFKLAFQNISEDQKLEQAAEDPVKKFLDMFPDLLAAGVCHVALPPCTDVIRTNKAKAFGYEYTSYNDGWAPKGLCVGILESGYIMLNKTTVFSVMVEQAKKAGVSFNTTYQTFWKRLKPLVGTQDGLHVGVKLGLSKAKMLGTSRAVAVPMDQFPAWQNWDPEWAVQQKPYKPPLPGNFVV